MNEISVGRWWNEICGREKGINPEKSLPRLRFVHRQTHMEWPRREVGTPAMGGERLTACATEPPAKLIIQIRRKIQKQWPSLWSKGNIASLIYRARVRFPFQITSWLRYFFYHLQHLVPSESDPPTHLNTNTLVRPSFQWYSKMPLANWYVVSLSLVNCCFSSIAHVESTGFCIFEFNVTIANSF